MYRPVVISINVALLVCAPNVFGQKRNLDGLRCAGRCYFKLTPG